MYDIGGIILFRSEDGALFTKNESEPFAILSATMKRLLIYLLQRQGQVCLRVDIFENVWEVYGLSASNNSLNKYISDLRKIVTSYGLTEDFIKTIPRAGFMISNDVYITIDSEKKSSASEENLLNIDKCTSKKKSSNKCLQALYLFIILNIFFILCAYKVISNNNTTNASITLASEFPIGKIDDCKVALVNGNNEQNDDIRKNVISDVIKSKKITCSENIIIYVFISESVLFEHKGRVFISKCNINSGLIGGHSSCKSFYETDYDNTK